MQKREWLTIGQSWCGLQAKLMSPKRRSPAGFNFANSFEPCRPVSCNASARSTSATV